MDDFNTSLKSHRGSEISERALIAIPNPVKDKLTLRYNASVQAAHLSQPPGLPKQCRCPAGS